MTAMMKAARLFEYAAPEVLQYGNYPQPTVGSQDVKVRRATADIRGTQS